MEWLTDKEKRILFSALTREKEICIQVDNDFNSITHYQSLKSVCESLEHKFYYDRLFKHIEMQIRIETINDFVDACKDNIMCQTSGLKTNEIEKIAKQLMNKTLNSKYGVDKICE